MDISEFRGKVILSLYGELDETQEKELTSLLRGDPKYISEYRHLVRTHFLAGQSEMKVTDELENEARGRLFEVLDQEESLILPGSAREGQIAGGGFWEQISNWLLPSGFEGWARCAASLAAGLLLGFLFIGNRAETAIDSVPDLASLDEDVVITNVKFTPAGENGRDVELSFSATRDYSFTDSIESPEVQKMLAYSLIRESNPGERIRTVELLGDNAGPNRQEIKKALLTTVVTDDNPVVRGEALSALRKYQSDTEVRNTLINVLRFDENPRVRIEAISMLSDSIVPGEKISAESVDAMRKQVEVEENRYMKIQLNNILETINLEQL